MGAVPIDSTKSILANLGADQLTTPVIYTGVAVNTVGRDVHSGLPGASMFLMGSK
jgi:hypothetical protein